MNRARMHKALDRVIDSCRGGVAMDVVLGSAAKAAKAKETDLSWKVTEARNKWLEFGARKGDDKYWLALQKAIAELEAHRRGK